MSARVPLPSATEVQQALTELSAQPGDEQPTVLALARSLGLANSTFWRHFPEIAREVAENRRSTAGADHTADAHGQPSDDRPTIENARLRRQNRELAGQIEIAIAHLQRLTLENHALREELEQSRTSTRLPQARPPADHGATSESAPRGRDGCEDLALTGEHESGPAASAANFWRSETATGRPSTRTAAGGAATARLRTVNWPLPAGVFCVAACRALVCRDVRSFGDTGKANQARRWLRPACSQLPPRAAAVTCRSEPCCRVAARPGDRRKP